MTGGFCISHWGQSGVEPSMRGPMGRASRPNGPKLESQQVREAKGDRPRQHGRAHVCSKGSRLSRHNPMGRDARPNGPKA
jgi:hypothetical protein